MVFKNHVGILLLLIIFFNIMECFNKNPFNNEICPRWYIPTGAAIAAFAILEIIGWIIYLCFIV